MPGILILRTKQYKSTRHSLNTTIFFCQIDVWKSHSNIEKLGKALCKWFGFQHSSVYIQTFIFCLQYQHSHFFLSNCYMLNVWKILFSENIVLFHPLKCFVTKSTSSIITFQKTIIRLLTNSSVAKSDLIIGIFETGFSGELPPKVCSCSSK